MTPTTRGPGQAEPDPAGPGRGFRGNTGREAIDPRGVLQGNDTPYEGNDRPVTGPTPRTPARWARFTAMVPQKRERGVYDAEPRVEEIFTRYRKTHHEL